MRNSIQTVGIIGSGPAGATLASLLKMKAWRDRFRRWPPARPDRRESLIRDCARAAEAGPGGTRRAVCQQSRASVSPSTRTNRLILLSNHSPARPCRLMPTTPRVRPSTACWMNAPMKLGVKRARVQAKVERWNGNRCGWRRDAFAGAVGPGRQPDLL